MPGGVTAEAPRRLARREGFAETVLEKRSLRLETGAPVTAAVALGEAVAAGFGDGAVRVFRPGLAPVTVPAHHGAVLCLAADAGHVLTGGDDGRFLLVSPEGAVEEIARFGTRWVDCVAAGPGWRACSSGRNAHVWRAGEPGATVLEHPSTVGGLAFDAKGGRLAVAHYGGATLWERRERRWRPSRLVWKGSHGAVAFSPDGKFLVTAMQENALHGWRLRDKADMRMSGYPGKVKSVAWVGAAPFLATSGADEAICWPFDGKDGPMGRGPATCAYGGSQLCTAIAGLVGLDGVFAGFQDGAVLAGRLAADAEDLVIKGSSGSPVTALAVTPEGWLFAGEQSGRAQWFRLGAGDA
jgi:WD40 repeat protein